MAEDVPKQIREGHARSQKALIEFLQADLNLAFTFLKTAAMESKVDPRHCRAVLEKTRSALGIICNLMGRVEDESERENIEGRVVKLEAALYEFRDSN